MTKTKKIRSAADDARKARARYVDQPGQWVDTTPESVRKRCNKEAEKLKKMMEKKPANKKRK